MIKITGKEKFKKELKINLKKWGFTTGKLFLMDWICDNFDKYVKENIIETLTKLQEEYKN